MVSFIDEHRGAYGVEPICQVLPIAPSTYREQAARAREPQRCPPRVRRDAVLRPAIERVWRENHAVYGARKVWKQLNRESIPVARCRVARLMRDLGLRGAVRGKAVKTTIPHPALACPRDKVQRNFSATAPNQLWVADFTYGAPSLWRRHGRRCQGLSMSGMLRTTTGVNAVRNPLLATEKREPKRR